MNSTQTMVDTNLVARGAPVSEPFHYSGISGPRLAGPDPDRGSYRSYASFSDPDGNGWPELLAEAEQRHGEYGSTVPKHHWSEWYAGYILARERGRSSDEALKDAALHIEATRDVARV
jgi:hypothetical protein